MTRGMVGASPVILDPASFAEGLRYLTQRDRSLARIVDEFGPPPMWARRPGFATLVHIVLEQQVSLASARAAMVRLRAAIAPVTPRRFLTLDDATLRAIGFSRQKTAYVRHLSQAVVERRFNPQALAAMGDDDARTALVQLKGIGAWTADIYLLMALRRADIWPSGDLALQIAAHEVWQLDRRPTAAELDFLAERWRPWRAVAARLLWHHYLSRPRLRLASRG
jgi:DNA-3-methyladenine glycosylase II